MSSAEIMLLALVQVFEELHKEDEEVSEPDDGWAEICPGVRMR